MLNFLRSYLKKVRRLYTNPYNYENTSKKGEKKHRTSYNYNKKLSKKSSGYKNNKNNRTRIRL